MNMSCAQVIVCEKSGRWATALHGALAKNQTHLLETRSLAQCSAALRSAPASFAAIAVTRATLQAALDLLVRASRSYPAARIVALLDPGLEPAESLLREAGAVDVLLTIRDAPRLAKFVLRHLELAPRQELSLREAVAQRLPWKRYETPDFAAQMGIASPTLS